MIMSRLVLAMALSSSILMPSIVAQVDGGEAAAEQGIDAYAEDEEAYERWRLIQEEEDEQRHAEVDLMDGDSENPQDAEVDFMDGDGENPQEKYESWRLAEEEQDEKRHMEDEGDSQMRDGDDDGDSNTDVQGNGNGNGDRRLTPSGPTEETNFANGQATGSDSADAYPDDADKYERWRLIQEDQDEKRHMEGNDVEGEILGDLGDDAKYESWRLSEEEQDEKRHMDGAAQMRDEEGNADGNADSDAQVDGDGNGDRRLTHEETASKAKSTGLPDKDFHSGIVLV